MEKKLRKNDHLGGWVNYSDEWMMMRMHQEIEELKEALATGDPDAIIDECGDVSNFAHMIADNKRRTRDGG